MYYRSYSWDLYYIYILQSYLFRGKVTRIVSRRICLDNRKIYIRILGTCWIEHYICLIISREMKNFVFATSYVPSIVFLRFASSIIFIFATSKVISLVLKMSRSKNPKKVWTIEKVLSQMLSRKDRGILNKGWSHRSRNNRRLKHDAGTERRRETTTSSHGCYVNSA